MKSETEILKAKIEELKAQNERLKKLLHYSNCNTRYLMTAIRGVYVDERMNQIEELQDEIENALK